MSIYELLSRIAAYVFEAAGKRERSALVIAGEVVECVRIDKDYVLIRFSER